MDRDVATALTFSDHARDRMTERGISEQEVRDALANAFRTETTKASARLQDVLTPSEMLERLEVSGTTTEGRRLRVTRSRAKPDLVVSVVELEEADAEEGAR
jgi:uncharacterized protein DUF4258